MPNPRKFEVYWTRTAEEDLYTLTEHIQLESIEVALHVLSQIRKKTAQLNTLPMRGRVVPELQEQGIMIYHELIYSPWRMIYKIEGVKVFVMAVVDSRRNVEDLLLERFLR